MRKGITFLLAAAMLFTLAACGSSGQSQQPAGNDKPAAAEPTPEPTEAPTPEPKEAWEIAESRFVITEKYGRNYGTAVLTIRNTGDTPLALPFDSLDLEDADGKLVASWNYIEGFPAVILPGEVGTYCENKSLDSSFPVDAEISVVPAFSVNRTRPAVRLDVSGIEIRPDDHHGVRHVGRVVNNTEDPVDDVVIVTLLFDAEDSFLGHILSFETDEIAPGGNVSCDQPYIGDVPVAFEQVAYSITYAYAK